MEERIVVKSLAVIRRPSDGALLVGETPDPSTGSVFHRSLGGHVEFGEMAEEAAIRELQEELGKEIRVRALLGVLQNHFRFDGRNGHEVVFVYDAEFVDLDAYDIDLFEFLDPIEATAGLPAVTWRPAAATEPPLYPSGVEHMLDNV